MKKIKLNILLGLILTGSVNSLSGQDEKAPFDPSSAQKSGLGLPSPIDKFMGLDAALGAKAVDWKKTFNDVAISPDMGALKEEVDICLALGVKIADGVMAIKARYAGGLNDSSKEIEALSAKLGVTKAELERAEKTRALANKDEWLAVFWELGCLQVDIMDSLNKKGNETRRPLIVASGWIEGVHYAAKVIDEQYTPELSNILREPMLVKAMIDETEALPEKYKSNARVQKLIKGLNELYKIVNVPVDGVIKKEDVRRMKELTGELAGEFVS